MRHLRNLINLKLWDSTNCWLTHISQARFLAFNCCLYVESKCISWYFGQNGVSHRRVSSFFFKSYIILKHGENSNTSKWHFICTKFWGFFLLIEMVKFLILRVSISITQNDDFRKKNLYLSIWFLNTDISITQLSGQGWIEGVPIGLVGPPRTSGGTPRNLREKIQMARILKILI